MMSGKYITDKCEEVKVLEKVLDYLNKASILVMRSHRLASRFDERFEWIYGETWGLWTSLTWLWIRISDVRARLLEECKGDENDG